MPWRDRTPGWAGLGGQWVSLRSRDWLGGSSAGESPEAGPCVSSGEPWDSRPSPAAVLKQRVGRPELTVGVHQGLAGPEGKGPGVKWDNGAGTAATQSHST